MKLYDNDEYRDDFMELVYSLLHGDGDNYRANQIIDAFDSAPEVEAEPLLPNDPLTLDELREMDGQPVWVELIGIKRPSAWYLLNLPDKEAVNKRGGFVSLIYYGDTWLAYRRRLEEGTT